MIILKGCEPKLITLLFILPSKPSKGGEINVRTLPHCKFVGRNLLVIQLELRWTALLAILECSIFVGKVVVSVSMCRRNQTILKHVHAPMLMLQVFWKERNESLIQGFEMWVELFVVGQWFMASVDFSAVIKCQKSWPHPGKSNYFKYTM